jgi:sister-chromatid-cohesion protein PDS5
MPFARLLYLLAVHPDTDWAADSESLRNNISFIELFVELVAHKDNVGLLYTIVTKLKTLRIAEEEFTAQKMDILVNGNGSGTLKDDDNDGNDEDDDIQSPTLNLYRLSEMAQIIISNRAHHHQWTLSSFPGKLKLPGDIFFNLPTLDAAQKVARKTFLPDDVAQIISAHKTKSSHSVSRSGSVIGLVRPVADFVQRRAAGDTSPRKRKAAAPKSASDKPKAPRKKRRTSGRHVDTEDEDSDEDSDEEDEDEDDEDEVSDEESASEEEEEEDDAPAVMGRGGRRNAKVSIAFNRDRGTRR